MAQEIERKFLVSGNGWQDEVKASYHIQQGYLVAGRGRTVRVRIRTLLTGDASASPECFVTMKFGAAAIVCDEYEYPIPYEDAVSLMAHAEEGRIVKIRHEVDFDGRTWEIDCYEERHAGLVVAEIEGYDVVLLNEFPNWVGKEITEDSYFKNAVLASTDTDWKVHIETMIAAGS